MGFRVSIDQARAAEHEKYVVAYGGERYRMKAQRREDAKADLIALPGRGAYLDVACGRGDMLEVARGLGFSPVMGTEIVPKLINGKEVVRAEVHALPFPDKSFDVATLYDVIEHLIPGDDEAACRELARVARRHVLIMANNFPSRLPDGRDLHINRRPYEEWDALFRNWFSGAVVTRIKPRHQTIRASETWRIDL